MNYVSDKLGRLTFTASSMLGQQRTFLTLHGHFSMLKSPWWILDDKFSHEVLGAINKVLSSAESLNWLHQLGMWWWWVPTGPEWQGVILFSGCCPGAPQAIHSNWFYSIPIFPIATHFTPLHSKSSLPVCSSIFQMDSQPGRSILVLRLLVYAEMCSKMCSKWL